MKVSRKSLIDETSAFVKRMAAVVTGLVTVGMGWAYFGFPTIATGDDILLVSEQVQDLRNGQDKIGTIIWTDKLLDYQTRLAVLEREIADRRESNREVDPVFYRQRRMLLESIRRAQRQLLLYQSRDLPTN